MESIAVTGLIPFSVCVCAAGSLGDFDKVFLAHGAHQRVACENGIERVQKLPLMHVTNSYAFRMMLMRPRKARRHTGLWILIRGWVC